MNQLLKLAPVGIVMALSAAAIQAATIDQTVFAPSAATDWNQSSVWGGNAVTSGNDYRTVAGSTNIETTFVIDVGGTTTTWQTFAHVRDNAPGTTFNGDHLIFSAGTRLTSKANSSPSTANYVLEDGSHLVLGANGSGVTGSFAGTISVSGTTAIGIRAITGGTTMLNVDAPISGSGTLQLINTLGGTSILNLNSDISLFSGTLLLSNATGKTTTFGVFTIANSSPTSTLQLNWESPFFSYDLSTNNVTFGSLVLGASDVLASGTYDATALNSLTGDTGIFTGTGTITVVPEPSTIVLAGLAALMTFAGFSIHRRLRV